MRIVAVLNQKGGVGKTTTSVNLGAALARSGHRVLLVDCDSQANLTDHLGVELPEGSTSIYDVLTEGASIPESVTETSTPGLFVLPADEDLAAAEQELAGEMAREFRLQRALAALDPGAYDWVLIDCPPSLGLLSLNAMAAADDLLITVQTEYFAMRGLGQIDQVISLVREHVNRTLGILGILPTLVSPVTRLAREVIEEIRAHYGPLVFETRIRQNIRLAEAPGHQVHIFDYDPQSAGAEDYAALGVEVESRAARPADGADTSATTPEGPEAQAPVVVEETDAEHETASDETAPSSEDAAPAPDEVAPAQAETPDDGTSDDGTSDDGTPDGGTPDGDAPVEAAPGSVDPAATEGPPEAIVPEASVPKAILPKAILPEAILPKASAPEAIIPEAIAPDAVAAEASDPGARIPEAVLPEAIVPEAAAPQADATTRPVEHPPTIAPMDHGAPASVETRPAETEEGDARAPGMPLDDTLDDALDDTLDAPTAESSVPPSRDA